MKAFQIDKYGGPDELALREIDPPIAKSGQVVVKIHATTLNPVDLKFAAGYMKDMVPLQFPWTPGADFSGEIAAIGGGVADFKIGDQVFGYSAVGGAYAEQIAIDFSLVALKPQSVSDFDAAAIALVGQTALQGIDAANLEAGQTIMIHGAAGAVGGSAVQLAHERGAHVIASTSAETMDMVKSFGADQVIDYKATPFETVVKDVDAVLDTVGGDTQTRSFAVIKPGGYLVALSQPPSPELAEKYGIHTVMLNTQSSCAGLEDIAKRINSGVLKANIGKVFVFDQIPTVWKDFARLHIAGKIVFKVRN